MQLRADSASRENSAVYCETPCPRSACRRGLVRPPGSVQVALPSAPLLRALRRQHAYKPISEGFEVHGCIGPVPEQGRRKEIPGHSSGLSNTGEPDAYLRTTLDVRPHVVDAFEVRTW